MTGVLSYVRRAVTRPRWLTPTALLIIPLDMIGNEIFPILPIELND
jgi:hypothetical protein